MVEWIEVSKPSPNKFTKHLTPLVVLRAMISPLSNAYYSSGNYVYCYDSSDLLIIKIYLTLVIKSTNF